MLEFCRTVDPNLQDYEADGVRSKVLPWSDTMNNTNVEQYHIQAWPTLLDDFVSSKKSNGVVADASDS